MDQYFFIYRKCFRIFPFKLKYIRQHIQTGKIKSVYYRTVLGAITSRAFVSCIGALDSVGVQLYHNSQRDEAKKAFQEALELLTKPDQYAVSEVAGTITRAECLNYMAMIALEEGNADELVFYAEQSASLTSELGKKVKNTIIFQTESYACSLLAEYTVLMVAFQALS